MSEPRGFAFPVLQVSPEGFPLMATGTDLDGASLKQILLTEIGERRMRPGFGAKLRQFLFEPQDDPTKMAIQAEVFRAVRDSTDRSAGPPRFALIKIDVNFPFKGQPTKKQIIAIDITYESFGRTSDVSVFVGA